MVWGLILQAAINNPEVAYHAIEIGVVLVSWGMALQRLRTSAEEVQKIKRNLHGVYTSLVASGAIKPEGHKWEE